MCFCGCLWLSLFDRLVYDLNLRLDLLGLFLGLLLFLLFFIVTGRLLDFYFSLFLCRSSLLPLNLGCSRFISFSFLDRLCIVLLLEALVVFALQLCSRGLIG